MWWSWTFSNFALGCWGFVVRNPQALVWIPVFHPRVSGTKNYTPRKVMLWIPDFCIRFGTTAKRDADCSMSSKWPLRLFASVQWKELHDKSHHERKTFLFEKGKTKWTHHPTQRHEATTAMAFPELEEVRTYSSSDWTFSKSATNLL